MSEHPLIIKKECAHSLFDCLNALSKKQLFIIAGQVMQPPFDVQRYTKAALIPILQAEIRKRMLYAFKYFYPFVSVFFIGFAFKERRDDIIKNFEEPELAKIPVDELEVVAAQMLMESGFCFAFLPKGRKRVEYVIPDELHAIAIQLADALSSEDTQPIPRTDLFLYGNVLTSLYGICPVDLFMDIYNRYAKDPIPDKQAFLWCMEEAASMSDSYYFIDDSVASMYIPYTDYDDISNYILNCRETLQPYIPSPEELMENLFCSSYEENTDAYRQCVDWFARYAQDEYEPQGTVELLCSYIKMGMLFEHQLELLQEHTGILNAIPRNKRELLIPLMLKLNDITRRWINWGHTENEIAEEDSDESLLNDSAETADTVDSKEQKSCTIQDIALPKDCRIPSAEEYETQRALFDDYCNHGHNLPWHRDAETHIRRIAPSYKKIAHIFDKMPDDPPEELFDQWLASIWHKKANRSGTFGNQQWNYAVFTPLEKLGDNIYSCEGHDGKIFVAYSPAIERFFGDYPTFMSVPVDMGGWYILYGPVIFWKGLFTFDFTALAKKVAPQMYKDQGLNAVIQFNPCPFWATSYLAHVPPVAHGNIPAIEYSLECTFKNNTIPELPKSWTREDAGNYTRWLYNKNDYLNSRRIYYNHKTHEVFLSAHNNDAFNKLLKNVSKYIDISKHGIEKMSMILTMFCYNTLKYPHKLAELEKKFEKSQRV